jgi:predicted O-methyltransferase YrrM
MAMKQLYTMRPESYRLGLEELIEYINTIYPTKELKMVEIGAYAGESTVLFAKHFKEVVTIDPFMNDYDPNDITCQFMELELVYERFLENIKPYDNITHIRDISDNAISKLNQFDMIEKVDFVYIDGLHTYDQVKKDIENYIPIINQNGFIAGHDFHPVWQGVIDAVLEKIGRPDMTFRDTSWIKQLKTI